jgi:hypothetical protein
MSSIIAPAIFAVEASSPVMTIDWNGSQKELLTRIGEKSRTSPEIVRHCDRCIAIHTSASI